MAVRQDPLGQTLAGPAVGAAEGRIDGELAAAPGQRVVPGGLLALGLALQRLAGGVAVLPLVLRVQDVLLL